MASFIVLRNILTNFKGTQTITSVVKAAYPRYNSRNVKLLRLMSNTDSTPPGGHHGHIQIRMVSTRASIRTNKNDGDDKDLPLEKDPSTSPYSVGSANILGGGPIANRIMSYSPTGFVVNRERVKGPVLLLPKSIVPWKVETHTDISIESLEILTKQTPAVEIVVIGTGDRLEFVNPAIVKFLRDSGIAVEIQGSIHACATYNFLAEEGRHAAAALIPPPSGRKK